MAATNDPLEQPGDPLEQPGCGLGDPSEHDPEPLRQDQERLRSAAADLRDMLDSVPPTFDASELGHGELTTTVNQLVSRMFKNTADLAARIEGLANDINPETGSFRGLPGICRTGRTTPTADELLEASAGDEPSAEAGGSDEQDVAGARDDRTG